MFKSILFVLLMFQWGFTPVYSEISREMFLDLKFLLFPGMTDSNGKFRSGSANRVFQLCEPIKLDTVPSNLKINMIKVPRVLFNLSQGVIPEKVEIRIFNPELQAFWYCSLDNESFSEYAAKIINRHSVNVDKCKLLDESESKDFNIDKIVQFGFSWMDEEIFMYQANFGKSYFTLLCNH